MSGQEKHTPGPWRWEINRKSRIVHLVGGKPQYDLTIMDFERWGMGSAVPRLRDVAHDGMNIMHKLCDRIDWIAPFANREHHANWCADVTHPDMRLIAAAPDLLEALQMLVQQCEYVGMTTRDDMPIIDTAHEAIKRATGAKP